MYFLHHFWKLLYAHSILTGTFLGLFIMTNVMVIALAASLTMISTWYIQLWQINYTITILSRKKNRSYQLQILLVKYRKALAYVASFTSYLSQAFMPMFVISIPVSCFFLKVALFDRINFYYQVIFFTLYGFLLFDDIVFHYIFAKYNSKLFKTSKRIALLSLRQQLKTRLRIKVSLFIQTTFTKRRYGVRYSRIALISMLSFAKVNKTPKYFHLFHSFISPSLSCSTLGHLSSSTSFTNECFTV